MSIEIQSVSQLPLFQAGHPASRPVLPGSAEAETMTAGSGRNLLASLSAFYRPGSWQKILLESLVLKTTWRSRNGLLAWKFKATRFSHRLYIQLQHSVPTTVDIESSLLPTLTATYRRGNKSTSPGAAYRPSLPEIARLLPTLRAGDAKGSAYQRDRGQKGKERLTLHGYAKLLPTLTARDHKSRGPSEASRRSPGLNCVAGGTLDPVFCEWYMGFENRWTDVESKP